MTGRKSDFDAIDSSHRLLLGIFRHAEETSLPCKNPGQCSGHDCADRSQCAHKVREAFHRVLFALIGHFGREDKMIRHVLPAESFERHVAGHAEITDAIQHAVTLFSIDKDAQAAFARISEIQKRYEAHHLTFDAEYLRHRHPGAG